MFSLLFCLLAQCSCRTQASWKSCSNCVLQILLLHIHAASIGIRAQIRFLPWHEDHMGEGTLLQMVSMNAMRLHTMRNQRHSFNEQRSGLMRFQSSLPPKLLEVNLKTTIQIHVLWRRRRILISSRRVAISKRMMTILKEFVQQIGILHQFMMTILKILVKETRLSLMKIKSYTYEVSP